jgi:hypothetical protein
VIETQRLPDALLLLNAELDRLLPPSRPNAFKPWQSTHPELFIKQVRDRPGSGAAARSPRCRAGSTALASAVRRNR